MTLGRYTKGPDSYIARAGTDSSYFDLGSEWNVIKDKYSLTDNEMFEYFNVPALQDAIDSGKTIRFSHNPLENEHSFLGSEWAFLKVALQVTDDSLIFEGGYWYVR